MILNKITTLSLSLALSLLGATSTLNAFTPLELDFSGTSLPSQIFFPTGNADTSSYDASTSGILVLSSTAKYGLSYVRTSPTNTASYSNPSDYTWIGQSQAVQYEFSLASALLSTNSGSISLSVLESSSVLYWASNPTYSQSTTGIGLVLEYDNSSSTYTASLYQKTGLNKNISDGTLLGQLTGISNSETTFGFILDNSDNSATLYAGSTQTSTSSGAISTSGWSDYGTVILQSYSGTSPTGASAEFSSLSVTLIPEPHSSSMIIAGLALLSLLLKRFKNQK